MGIFSVNTDTIERGAIHFEFILRPWAKVTESDWWLNAFEEA